MPVSILAAERPPRLAEARAAPGGIMQLAGLKDGVWVYTEPESGVQNGNPGVEDETARGQHRWGAGKPGAVPRERRRPR